MIPIPLNNLPPDDPQSSSYVPPKPKLGNKFRGVKELTVDERSAIMSFYLKKISPTKIAAHFNLAQQTLYRVIERHGKYINKWSKRDSRGRYHLKRNHGSSISNKPPILRYCTICGKQLQAPKEQKIQRGGDWKTRSTCGSDDCRFFLQAMPWLRFKEQPKSFNQWPRKWTNNWQQILDDVRPLWAAQATAWDIQAHDKAQEDTGERLFETSGDLRLSDRPAAKESIWGTLTGIAVAIRTIDRTGNRISLEIVKRSYAEKSYKAFLKPLFKDLKSGTQYLDNFDYLYVWRCTCSQQSTFEVRSLKDLPDKVGYYGVCETCHAIALQIRVEK